MVEDRRNYARRGEVIRRIVDSVVQNPGARFTFPRFRAMLGVPEEAARRILAYLASSGLVVEIERGVWARIPSLPAVLPKNDAAWTAPSWLRCEHPPARNDN